MRLQLTMWCVRSSTALCSTPDDLSPCCVPSLQQVQQFTDSGAAATDDVVCAFEDCAVLNPRGRFEISMHLSFLSLLGQVRV